MENSPSLIQQISEKLCVEFQRVLSPAPDQIKKQKKLSESEIKSASEEKLKKFYDLARSEIQKHRLGVIGRARIAFSLQQRLLQAGYAPSLVKQVLFAMLISVFVGSK